MKKAYVCVIVILVSFVLLSCGTTTSSSFPEVNKISSTVIGEGKYTLDDVLSNSENYSAVASAVYGLAHFSEISYMDNFSLGTLSEPYIIKTKRYGSNQTHVGFKLTNAYNTNDYTFCYFSSFDSDIRASELIPSNAGGYVLWGGDSDFIIILDADGNRLYAHIIPKESIITIDYDYVFPSEVKALVQNNKKAEKKLIYKSALEYLEKSKITEKIHIVDVQEDGYNINPNYKVFLEDGRYLKLLYPSFSIYKDPDYKFVEPTAGYGFIYNNKYLITNDCTYSISQIDEANYYNSTFSGKDETAMSISNKIKSAGYFYNGKLCYLYAPDVKGTIFVQDEIALDYPVSYSGLVYTYEDKNPVFLLGFSMDIPKEGTPKELEYWNLYKNFDKLERIEITDYEGNCVSISSKDYTLSIPGPGMFYSDYSIMFFYNISSQFESLRKIMENADRVKDLPAEISFYYSDANLNCVTEFDDYYLYDFKELIRVYDKAYERMNK